jgi:hypothetical protein
VLERAKTAKRRIRDASVGIATGRMAGVKFLAGQEVFLYSAVPRLVPGPTHPFVKWVQGKGQSSRGMKLHSPGSGADVKNSGVIPSLPKCFHVMVLN